MVRERLLFDYYCSTREAYIDQALAVYSLNLGREWCLLGGVWYFRCLLNWRYVLKFVNWWRFWLLLYHCDCIDLSLTFARAFSRLCLLAKRTTYGILTGC